MVEALPIKASARARLMLTRCVMTALGFLATFLALKPQFFVLPWKFRIWEFRVLLPLDLLYYLAFLLIPVPFTILTQRIPLKWIIFGPMVANVISTCFSEFIFLYDKFDRAMVFNLVFMVELTKDILYPTIGLMVSKWSQPNERSFISSVIYSGASLGSILVRVGLETNGTIRLCITALLGVIWCFTWSVVATSSPEWMSENEKVYIRRSFGTRKDNIMRKLAFPFKKIFTSKPFISLAIVHICVSAVCVALTLVEYRIIQEPRNASLPIVKFFPLHHMLTVVFTIFFGGLMSLLLKQKIITLTKSRKIATFISLFLPLLCLILAVCIKNRFAACILIMIGFMFSGAKYSGSVINIIDLAPNFSAILLAIFTTIETIWIILQAWIAEHLSRVMLQGNYGDVWIILLALAGVSSSAMVFYWRHGLSEEQPWNRKQVVASINNGIKILPSESRNGEEQTLNP